MKTATLLATISAASNRTSGIYDLGDLTAFAIGVLISGSDVAGTLTMECSDDGSTFVTVTGSSVSITSSADHVYDVTACGYRYVRAKWVASSGTGNITITITAKEHTVRDGG